MRKNTTISTEWEARLVSEPVWMILLFCRVMKHSF